MCIETHSFSGLLSVIWSIYSTEVTDILLMYINDFPKPSNLLMHTDDSQYTCFKEINSICTCMLLQPDILFYWYGVRMATWNSMSSTMETQFVWDFWTIKSIHYSVTRHIKPADMDYKSILVNSCLLPPTVWFEFLDGYSSVNCWKNFWQFSHSSLYYLISSSVWSTLAQILLNILIAREKCFCGL